MIVNWLRADMFEHSNRHEPQPDSIERVNEAEGDALRFNALLVEYLRALEVFAENAGTCIRQAERSEWMRQTIEQMNRQKSHELQPVTGG